MSLRQEQWMEVGMAFECPYKKRTPRQKRITVSGLRWAVSEVMGSAVLYLPPAQQDGEWWLAGNRFLRAFLAYLMAAMTDAERDDIVEGL